MRIGKNCQAFRRPMLTMGELFGRMHPHSWHPRSDWMVGVAHVDLKVQPWRMPGLQPRSFWNDDDFIIVGYGQSGPKRWRHPTAPTHLVVALPMQKGVVGCGVNDQTAPS